LDCSTFENVRMKRSMAVGFVQPCVISKEGEA
jgi:hypothetical protein